MTHCSFIESKWILFVIKWELSQLIVSRWQSVSACAFCCLPIVATQYQTVGKWAKLHNLMLNPLVCGINSFIWCDNGIHLVGVRREGGVRLFYTINSFHFGRQGGWRSFSWIKGFALSERLASDRSWCKCGIVWFDLLLSLQHFVLVLILWELH